MKATLLHCYSDNNKGDQGIILSTVDIIKKIDKNIKIAGISTYNPCDPLFKTEHKIIKKKISLYPGIFGELNIRSHKSNLAKIFKFLLDLLKLFIYLIDAKNNSLAKVFYKNDMPSLNTIKKSDILISKGGSFLCNENSIRSKVSLIRLLFIFFLCIKYKKKYVLLGQSIGPVEGQTCRLLVNYILAKASFVILRERDCKNKYSYLKFSSPTYYLNDFAFFLQSAKKNPLKIKLRKKTINIGMTIKDVGPKYKEKYFKLLNRITFYSMNRFKAKIFIFPQVTIEKDIEASYEWLKHIPDKYKENIIIFTENYTCFELKKMYSKMDFFISTRLHSAIFAMAECIPALCISYHGTKAIGIFKKLDLQKYVIKNYNLSSVKIVDDLFYNKNKISKYLEKSIYNHKRKMYCLLKKII